MGIVDAWMQHPARGSRKVLSGTSYSMLTASPRREGLASLDPSAEAQRLFLSGNARRVLKLEKTGS